MTFLLLFRRFPGIQIPFSWKNLNPVKMLERYEKHPLFKADKVEDLIEHYKELFGKAGITDGYQSKYCVGPYDPECPTTSPNHNSSEVRLRFVCVCLSRLCVDCS